MKPCFRQRRPIAEMVVGGLEPGAAATLRQHLARCEGCRRYWEDLTSVTQDLAVGAGPSRLEASATFHRRVTARVRARAEAPACIEGRLRGLGFRRQVALAALTVLAATLLGWMAVREQPAAARPGAAVVREVVGAEPERRMASSLVQYRAAAAQSLDLLEALLDRQGRQRLSGVPEYTAAGVRVGGGVL